MKNILVLITSLAIMGCTTTVPVKQEFPGVPAVLMEKCEPLTTIDQESIVFSEFLKVVSANYTKYHTCATMMSAWQEWYTAQKKIMDEVNK